MSAESELYTLLSTDPVVMGLVASRIYPDVIDRDVDVPAIAYVRTGTEPEVTLDGAIAPGEASIEIACYGHTKAAAEALADALEDALEGSAFGLDGRRGGYNAEVERYETIVSITHYD